MSDISVYPIAATFVCCCIFSCVNVVDWNRIWPLSFPVLTRWESVPGGICYEGMWELWYNCRCAMQRWSGVGSWKDYHIKTLLQTYSTKVATPFNLSQYHSMNSIRNVWNLIPIWFICRQILSPLEWQCHQNNVNIARFKSFWRRCWQQRNTAVFICACISFFNCSRTMNKELGWCSIRLF